MKNTVVQVSSVHYPFDTRIFVKECQSLLKGGYEVHLIAQHSKNEIVDGIKIFALPQEKNKLDRLTKVIPSLFKKIWKYPKGTIFHFHDSELILFFIFFRVFGYKVIYDIHEHTPKDFLTKDWLPVWLRYPLSFTVQVLEFFAGIVFNGIVTVVPPVTKRFKHCNNVELSNYPKLDEVFFKQLNKKTAPIENNTVIYIGNMTEIRGLRVMIDAINLVDTKYDPILRLGGMVKPKELEYELKSTKDWNRIEELGWLNMSQIWEYLFRARVGLVLLQPTPAHLVLESVKMFEYMAAGIPVISSNFPLYKKIVDECNCGFSVDPTNPNEIANAIEWLFEHPEKAEEMGNRGQKAVLNRYNWELEEQELLDFYSKL